MNLRYTLLVLLRRWYVVLPVLVLTIVGAFAARQAARPGYTVSSNLAVLPPDRAVVRQADGSVETIAVNPFLNFTGSTQTAASALALIAGSPTFRDTLDPVARSVAYTVSVPPRNPTLQVDVVSTSPDRAAAAAAAVTRGLQAELQRRQASAPRSQSLSVTVLTPPGVSAIDNARLRSAAVVGVLGFLLAVLLGCLVEFFAARRGALRTSGVSRSSAVVADAPHRREVSSAASA